jgi:glucokinase
MSEQPTALGIDIGGTNFRIAEVDATGALLRRQVERVAAGREALLGQITERAGQWAGSRQVRAIGVGIPGRVDAAARRILSAGYLDLADAPLVERLEAATGLPTALENDGSMALVAECAVGAARGLANVAMFTIGTGIGGAIVQDGRLLHGQMTAGQVGHITVRPGGRPCNCGRRGCVETTSSGTALGLSLAEAGFPAGTTVETLFARAEQREAAAIRVLDEWARPLRDAATTLVAVLDPALVLLGGGLGRAMCRALARLEPETSWFRCDIRLPLLGDEAGMIGAGLRALDFARTREGKAT